MPRYCEGTPHNPHLISTNFEGLTVLEHDFKENLGYWVGMASRAFERALNEELAPHGITLRQCQVLGWLALEKELTLSQLADRLRIEPPTLVRILDRME